MGKSPILTLLLILLLVSVLPAFPQSVNQVPDLPARLGEINKIAIAPIEPCPAALNCSVVESAFYMRLLERRARSSWQPIVVPAEKTRQKMFELGLMALGSSEERARLAEALSAQALLIPSVLYVESKFQRADLLFPAGNVPEGRVVMSLFAANPETLLFRGEHQGRGTTLNGQEGLIGTLLRQLLEKFYPKSGVRR